MPAEGTSTTSGDLLAIDKYLTKLYTVPSKSGAAFSSVEPLYQAARREGRFKISRHHVKKFLSTQRAHTINRQRRLKFQTSRVVVGAINELHQADLAIMDTLAPYNDGVRNWLLVVDCFSKVVHLRMLLDKSAETVLKAFKDIYANPDSRPLRLQVPIFYAFKNSQLTDLSPKNNY